ncbi:MAG: UbiA family prenyltransferase [Candidatus Pacebacteria bacterium]|nr:UbiA family prenyltransferase [Candidatus Paceibacterota bacterium]
MNNLINWICREVAYGGHAQCLATIGIVYVSSFLLELNVDWQIMTISYLSFYLIYIKDRIGETKIDQLTNPERSKHIENSISIIRKTMIFSIIFIGLLLFLYGNLIFNIFIIFIILLGSLYPSVFKPITKRIVAFKNIFVAIFFSVVTIIPVLYHKIEINNELLVPLLFLMLFVFIKTILMQMLLDCKDIDGDKKIKLLTIPTIIGKEETLKMLKIVNTTITILIPIIGFIFGIFPTAMLALIFIVFINLYAYKLAEQNNYNGYVIEGSEFFFWMILIFISKNII